MQLGWRNDIDVCRGPFIRAPWPGLSDDACPMQEIEPDAILVKQLEILLSGPIEL